MTDLGVRLSVHEKVEDELSRLLRPAGLAVGGASVLGLWLWVGLLASSVAHHEGGTSRDSGFLAPILWGRMDAGWRECFLGEMKERVIRLAIAPGRCGQHRRSSDGKQWPPCAQ